MRPRSFISLRNLAGAFATALIVHLPVTLWAQTVEIAPLGGYRFGGDLFEIVTNRPVDLDVTPVVGGTVNVDIGEGLWFEGLFTHQQALVSVPAGSFGPAIRSHVTVDQWLAGGRQEWGRGRARPFLTGLVGLTRYGAEADNEIRFAVSAGGGAMLLLQRRLGVRLDGRIFTTVVDANARAGVCSPGLCIIHLNANLAWQAEFSAGLVVAF